MKRSIALLVFVSALVVACDRGPATGPQRAAPTATGPRFDFLNGPDTLPNVVRFDVGYAVGIQDPVTNLIAWAGLPDTPSLLATCHLGGDAAFQTVDVQDAGALQDVVHRIRLGDGINLHVFAFTGFTGICSSTPIAQGVGRLTNEDNDHDALVSGFPGANTWGWHMEGPVTLATGGDASLVAHNRFVTPPEGGSSRRIFRKVDLNGM